jgi:hypothetical protein
MARDLYKQKMDEQTAQALTVADAVARVWKTRCVIHITSFPLVPEGVDCVTYFFGNETLSRTNVAYTYDPPSDLGKALAEVPFVSQVNLYSDQIEIHIQRASDPWLEVLENLKRVLEFHTGKYLTMVHLIKSPRNLNIEILKDLTDTYVLAERSDSKEHETVYALGSRGDSAAGEMPWTLTPYFNDLEELDAFCGKHIETIKAVPDGEPFPYLGEEGIK